MNRGAG